MAYDPVHDEFISQAAKDSYSAQALENAERDGVTPKQAMLALAKEFKARHKADPTAGYEHLYAWASDTDPAPADTLDPGTLALMKARESARREPQLALAGHPEVLKAAKEAFGAQEQTSDVSASATATSGS